MKFFQLSSSLKQDILLVEQQLEQSVRSDHAMLSETSLHLLKAGGKRIRPVFVLLAGRFGKYSLERLANVAVCLELIHMATLVHDDVIDDAQIRRGQLTVKSKWDNRIAMFTGDYIFAKALMVATRLENPRIHQILSKAIVEMCIGEMEQIRFFYRSEQTVRQYLLRIRRKTALLMAISCQLGAVAADADERVCRRMYAYGYNAGMAFQIRDDVLDLCGTEQELGKPPGSDIRQGNITLPVIYALEDRALQREIVAGLARIRDNNGEANVAEVLDLVHRSDGLRRAEHMASRYIEKAVAALDDLPDIEQRQTLIDIAYFVGSRSY